MLRVIEAPREIETALAEVHQLEHWRGLLARAATEYRMRFKALELRWRTPEHYCIVLRLPAGDSCRVVLLMATANADGLCLLNGARDALAETAVHRPDGLERCVRELSASGVGAACL